MTVEKLSPASARIIPNCFVLLSLGIVTLLFATPMYLLGRQAEESKRFLKVDRAPNCPEAEMNFPMSYALESSEANDVIFLGDSVCRVGIDPSLFTELTGYSAWNLGGQFSLGIDGMQLILQAYLARHPQPRAVVLTLNTNIMELTLDDYAWREMHERFLWCYGSRDYALRQRATKSVAYLVGAGVRTAYLLAAERRLALDGQPSFADRIMPGSRGLSYRMYEIEMRKHRGYCPLPDSSIHSQPVSEDEPDPPFIICSEYKSGLRELAGMLQQKQIPLIVRLAPLSAYPAAREFADVEATLKDLERSFPDCHVGMPIILQYDDKLFFDTAHLNSVGAKEFTTLIAAEVNRVLAAPPPSDNSGR